jgi:transcriptional regulator with XRE-family HTH domain
LVPLAPKHRRVLGKNIRVRRTRIGITQEKLAEKADLNPAYVSEVERGQENISVDALMRVATALNLTVHDLTRGL